MRACYVPSCFQKYGHEGPCDPPMTSPPPGADVLKLELSRAIDKAAADLGITREEALQRAMRIMEAKVAELDPPPSPPAAPAVAELLPWNDYERDYFKTALNIYAGNKSMMARRLGLNRRSLYRTLERLGLHNAA